MYLSVLFLYVQDYAKAAWDAEEQPGVAAAQLCDFFNIISLFGAGKIFHVVFARLVCCGWGKEQKENVNMWPSVRCSSHRWWVCAAGWRRRCWAVHYTNQQPVWSLSSWSGPQSSEWGLGLYHLYTCKRRSRSGSCSTLFPNISTVHGSKCTCM